MSSCSSFRSGGRDEMSTSGPHEAAVDYSEWSALLNGIEAPLGRSLHAVRSPLRFEERTLATSPISDDIQPAQTEVHVREIIRGGPESFAFPERILSISGSLQQEQSDLIAILGKPTMLFALLDIFWGHYRCESCRCDRRRYTQHAKGNLLSIKITAKYWTRKPTLQGAFFRKAHCSLQCVSRVLQLVLLLLRRRRIARSR
jgi:hypothetical protein